MYQVKLKIQRLKIFIARSFLRVILFLGMVFHVSQYYIL